VQVAVRQQCPKAWMLHERKIGYWQEMKTVKGYRKDEGK
jgi:hypothetical protein